MKNDDIDVFSKMGLVVIIETVSICIKVFLRVILISRNMWDVLKRCEREGSADSAIREEEVNDFDQFFKDHPQIQMIAFNGKNAEDYFKSFYPRDLGFKTLTLPSTSPVNTWKSYDQKLAEWTGLLMF